MTRKPQPFMTRSFAALAVALALPGAAGAQVTAPTVSIVLLAPDAASLESSAARGAVLGGEEAAQTARLLARSTELRVLRADTAPDIPADIQRSGAGAVLSLLAAPLTDSLATALAPVLVISLVSPPDSLPRVRTLRNVLHVVPADSARAEVRRRAGESAVRALAWLGSLDRFGAAQLNARYTARFHAPMDEAAWLGWFAVKAIAETALRAPAGQALELAAALRGERARFDGHKGAALRFDPVTGELQQPLYPVDAAGQVVQEARR